MDESKEFIKGYFWPFTFALVIYTSVYAFLVTKIKDKLPFKKARNVSVISLLIIILITITDKSQIPFQQKLAARYYTIFPTSLFYTIKTVYEQYEVVKSDEPIKEKFKFNAIQKSTYKGKQIHLLIIGESASFYHWTASGYNRKTTPSIDTISNLYLFNNTHTSAFITEFAVPIMLTGISPKQFKDHSKQKSIMGAFQEAGFTTYWICNQVEMGRIKYHSKEASEQVVLSFNVNNKKEFHDDSKLLGLMDSVVALPGDKKLIVIHLQGSHYDYSDRYPDKFDYYKPSNKTVFTAATDFKNKQIIINSYDNSLLYTDFILNAAIDRIKKEDVFSTVFYMSDHGENLFEDERKLSQHAYDKPSKYISWIPFFIWTSDKLKAQIPKKIDALKTNLHKRNSTENLFYTFTDLVGIQHILSDSTKSLSSPAFKEKTTFILGRGLTIYNTDSLK